MIKVNDTVKYVGRLEQYKDLKFKVINSFDDEPTDYAPYKINSIMYKIYNKVQSINLFVYESEIEKVGATND